MAICWHTAEHVRRQAARTLRQHMHAGEHAPAPIVITAFRIIRGLCSSPQRCLAQAVQRTTPWAPFFPDNAADALKAVPAHKCGVQLNTTQRVLSTGSRVASPVRGRTGEIARIFDPQSPRRDYPAGTLSAVRSSLSPSRWAMLCHAMLCYASRGVVSLLPAESSVERVCKSVWAWFPYFRPPQRNEQLASHTAS